MRLKVFGATVALAMTAGVMAAAPAAASRPPTDAVVAFIDTGINPYHLVFRDKSARAYRHPSTYLEGYPKSAKALRISLGVKDWATAVRRDCKLWKSVKEGQLYWFPGTKIVGAISFGVKPEINCLNPLQSTFRILDTGGHGTMVASRGTGKGYGACPRCRAVAIQNPMSASLYPRPESSTNVMIESIRFAARNSDWIDAQSNSWGPIASGWSPTEKTGLWTANGDLVRAVEDVSRKHLSFWASGNGITFRWGVLGHPTLLSPHLTPSAIIVGGHDSGYVNTWPGFPPHIVSDSCNAWAAHYDKTRESDPNVAGGTSGATPFAAGGAARILLEARQILGDTTGGIQKGAVARGPRGRVSGGPLADGVFTLKEWKEVTFKTATQRPERQKQDGTVCGPTYAPWNSTPVKWEDVPKDYPEYIHIGYGAIDNQSRALAMKVIRGNKKLPKRADTARYFAMDDQARRALYDLWSKEI